MKIISPANNANSTKAVLFTNCYRGNFDFVIKKEKRHLFENVSARWNPMRKFFKAYEKSFDPM